jgi:hypothetical protein
MTWDISDSEAIISVNPKPLEEVVHQKHTPNYNNCVEYAKHPRGEELRAMSDQMDRHPEFLDWVEADLHPKPVLDMGAHGMSVESIL